MFQKLELSKIILFNNPNNFLLEVNTNYKGKGFNFKTWVGLKFHSGSIPRYKMFSKHNPIIYYD